MNVMKLDIVDECLKGMPHDQEVMGSNLVRGSLSLLSQEQYNFFTQK